MRDELLQRSVSRSFFILRKTLSSVEDVFDESAFFNDNDGAGNSSFGRSFSKAILKRSQSFLFL